MTARMAKWGAGTNAVDEGDPRPPLPPRGHRTAEAETAELHDLLEGAALVRHDESRPDERDGEARVDGGPGRALPPDDDTREEVLPRAARVGEVLLAPVAVVADGRRVDQPDGLAGAVAVGDEGLGDRPGGVRARPLDLALVLGVPPTVTDADAREVDDGVDTVERALVEPSAGGVPLDLVRGGGGVAHETDDLVTAFGEGTTKRAADQAGRAGDGDALRHGVLLMQGTSGLEPALFEPGLHRAEEPSGVGPVDDAVVVGQREVHHRAD